MATKTKNTKAFYNTEIPSDWDVKKFEKIAKFFSGGTPLTSKSEYYSGNIPFIKSGEIYFDKTEQFISDEGLNNSSAKMVEKGDLLYALYGANSGEVAISKINGAINQAILCIRHNGDCETVFIYNYLLQQKENIIRTYLQGGQGNLSAEIVKTLPIPLPPLPEQKAIAQVLSTADAAIHTTEKLIAQKELRKKWLMQQLLTGKKRLKGFSGEWKEKKLEYFIKEYKLKPTDENTYEVLTSAKAGLMKQTDYYGDNRITNRDDADYNVIPPNYLTYRSRSDDGLFTFNKNDLGITGLISGYYPVFTIKNGDINFILMYMNYYRQKLTKYAIGTSQLVLAMNALKEAKFHLPPEEEQTAIAQVLKTADKEISLLKAKVEKLREQKKGLMQVLLTGKVRLKIKE